jgi:hypothetical protein
MLSALPTMLVNHSHNMHLVQALSWLKGNWELPSYLHDVAIYEGKYYNPFPPFPAFLLLPFVVICGLNCTNLVVISLFLTLLNGILFYKILQKVNQTNLENAWWIAAFFCGTGYWWVLISSRSVYCFSHLVAVTALFAMLYALYYRLFWLAGCMLGVAFLTRQMTIFHYILLFFWLYKSDYQRELKHWLLMNLPVLFSVFIYLGYNYIRFDNPFETGYKYISSDALFHAQLVKKYGIFHFIYIPYNFYYMFLHGFSLNMSPPFYWENIQLDPYGTSLVAASPFLLLAFQANYKDRRNMIFAISVIIVLIFTLMYQNNGWVQYNTQRFSLDFLPILMLLAIEGGKSFPTRWTKALIIYSVLLNMITLFFYFLGKITTLI